jgi:hypothetical protein
VKKSPRNILLGALLALLLACSSDDTSPTGTNGDENPPPPGDGQATASAREVTDIAAGLYAATTAAEASQALRDFFVKFGLPIHSAPPTEAAAVSALTFTGPYVLDVQIDRVAEALVDGVLVDLDSYFRSLYPWSVRVTGGGPITRQYMTDRLLSYGVFDKLDGGGDFNTEEDLVPAMIVALGRERSSRTWFDETGQVEDRWRVAWSDSVWGDNSLDPVQFLLLTQAFLLSSVADSLVAGSSDARQNNDGGPDRAAPQIDILGRLAKGLIAGVIGKDIEVPLTPVDAIDATICSSVLLFGYTFEIQVDNKQINRPAIDPTVDPYVTTSTGPEVAAIKVKLVYKPLPGGPIESICEDPGLFPSRNKPIFFEDVGNMIYDGNLDIVPSHTDDFGEATATYRASAQAVPPYLRSATTQTTGWVWVKARDLVPGWSNLELGVDFLRNPTQSAAQLYITHYGPAVGVRVGDRIIGEVTGGDPLGSSGMFCGRGQLRGMPLTASRTFTDEGTDYSTSLTLVPAGPMGTEVRIMMSIDNQSASVTRGITLADAIAIDVVNPQPDPRRRIRATWNESSVPDTFGSSIWIGCRDREFAIFNDNSGSGVDDESISSHGYLVVVPRIIRRIEGPDSWTGDLSITLEEEAP